MLVMMEQENRNLKVEAASLQAANTQQKKKVQICAIIDYYYHVYQIKIHSLCIFVFVRYLFRYLH